MNNVTREGIVASQMMLPEGDMTRAGMKEYLEAIRGGMPNLGARLQKAELKLTTSWDPTAGRQCWAARCRC